MSTTNYPVSANRNATMRETAQRPQWLDDQLYPFQSRFVEIDGNRIHYIDEGTGPILFFLHPGVGWSFIFRDIIKDLRTHFRCVALDLNTSHLKPKGGKTRQESSKSGKIPESKKQGAFNVQITRDGCR